MLMVKNLMTEDVVTSKLGITVKDAFVIMREKHVGSIIIVDDHKKCIGIFTERDAIRVIASDLPLHTSMAEVMTRNVVTIGEEASLQEAKQLIISHGGIRHLPVVNSGGELVGLFSIRKLLDEIFGLTV